jgi:hypothetical protein
MEKYYSKKNKIADTLKTKYLIPAKKMLEAEIAKGNLPKSCMMLFGIKQDLEIVSNVKKLK